jgi:flagellar secretion chaperone FliS
MFGMKQSGVNAYAKVGLETGVVDASPLKMIVMLYEGAITACIHAQQAMQKQDVVKKGEYLAKAVSIINSGLRASLDKGTGGDIANNLDDLYQYMTSTLMQASVRQDVRKVQEIQQLLMELKAAWQALEKNSVGKVAQAQTSFNNVVSQKSQLQADNFNRLAVAGA